MSEEAHTDDRPSTEPETIVPHRQNPREIVVTADEIEFLERGQWKATADSLADDVMFALQMEGYYAGGINPTDDGRFTTKIFESYRQEDYDRYVGEGR